MRDKAIYFLPKLIFSALVFMILLACSKEKENPPYVYIAPPPLNTSEGSAAVIITAMGTGFNLGQTFDASQHSTVPGTIYPIIDMYYNAGLRHVRIPVTWMQGFSGNTLADVNGNLNVNHPRLLQLKNVIDYALSKKDMYVVLNTHHEHWLKKSYNSAVTDSAFSTLWKGIANYFKAYPNRLLFEVLNEPEGNLGDWNGGANPSTNAAIQLTRQVNKIGYNAIRNTGGENAKRVVLIQPNGQGNASQLDDVYPTKSTLPGEGKDSYLAAEVHAYDPWAFCGETGKNSSYPGKTSVINSITTTVAHARSLGLPINYGEFGVGRSSNASERNSDVVREYYSTVVGTLRNEKMSATAWDDRGWFALISGNSTTGYSFVNNIVPTFMLP